MPVRGQAKHSKTLRKKPKQQRSKILVDAVFGAATQILPKLGFDRFTTNKVADRAGVSIGSIYQYFPNKESILVPVTKKMVLQHNRILVGQFKVLTEQCKSVDELCEKMIEFAVDSFLQDPEETINTYGHFSRLGLEKFFLETREGMRALISDQLGNYYPNFTPSILFNKSYIIVHSVMGVVLARLYGVGAEVSLVELKRELVLLVSNYLKEDSR